MQSAHRSSEITVDAAAMQKLPVRTQSKEAEVDLGSALLIHVRPSTRKHALPHLIGHRPSMHPQTLLHIIEYGIPDSQNSVDSLKIAYDVRVHSDVRSAYRVLSLQAAPRTRGASWF